MCPVSSAGATDNMSLLPQGCSNCSFCIAQEEERGQEQITI